MNSPHQMTLKLIAGGICLCLTGIGVHAQDTITSGTTGARSTMPRAFNARPMELRPSSITADYYMVEGAEDWGYEKDFDYDVLSYDKASSVYSLYDTYYNNYEVIPGNDIVLRDELGDPIRDERVMTPADGRVEPENVGSKSPLVNPPTTPGESSIVDSDSTYKPNEAYGYRKTRTTGEEGDWFYDFYNRPEKNGQAQRPNSQNLKGYEYLTDFEGDGPGDGLIGTWGNKKEGRTKADSSKQDKSANKQNGQGDVTVAEVKSPEMLTVAGTIQHAKNVSVDGEEMHRLIHVRTQSDAEYVIDLGSVENLAEMDLVNGSTISVTGEKSVVGEKELVIAESITKDAQTMQVPRNQRIVEGNIVQTMTIDHAGESIILAVVEDNLDQYLVDMGMVEIGKKIVLKEGNPVTATGVAYQTDRGMILLAQTVKQKETSVNVTRPAEDQQTETASGQATNSEEKPKPKMASATVTDENGNKRKLTINYDDEGNPKAKKEVTPAPGATADSANENQNANANAAQEAMVVVKGTILEVMEKQVWNTKRKFALTKTQGGNRVVLELGRVSQNAPVIEAGAEVIVAGVPTRMNTKMPRILVHRVTVNNETFTARRFRPDLESKQVSGEVQSYQTSEVMGKTHGIVTISSGDNQTWTVDIGEVAADKAPVSDGNTLSVTGIPVQHKGKDLLVAQSYQVK